MIDIIMFFITIFDIVYLTTKAIRERRERLRILEVFKGVKND